MNTCKYTYSYNMYEYGNFKCYTYIFVCVYVCMYACYVCMYVVMVQCSAPYNPTHNFKEKVVC